MQISLGSSDLRVNRKQIFSSVCDEDWLEKPNEKVETRKNYLITSPVLIPVTTALIKVKNKKYFITRTNLLKLAIKS